MPAAKDAALLDRGSRAERPALDVIELHLVRGAADAPALEWPRAAAVVTLPDAPPHVGGDVAAPLGRRRCVGGRRRLLRSLRTRLRADPAPPRVALEDEVETDLDDGLLGRAWVGMREGIPRGGELREEAAGDGHVKAALLRGERIDPRPLLAREWRHDLRGVTRVPGLGRRVCRRQFFRKNLERRRGRRSRGRGADRRHDRAERRRRGGDELRDDLPRLALRQVEEPGRHLGAVLRGDDPRELGDAREVEPAVAQGVNELGVLADEPGGGHPVVGGALGQAELAVEEVEQRAVPQLDPAPRLVEGREGDEEVGHGEVFTLQELCEAGGLFTRGGHARIVSRSFETSGNARIRVLARPRAKPARTPPAASRRAQEPTRRAPRPRHARCPPRKRRRPRNASTSQMGRASPVVNIRRGRARVPAHATGEPGHAETVPARRTASAPSPSLL